MLEAITQRQFKTINHLRKKAKGIINGGGVNVLKVRKWLLWGLAPISSVMAKGLLEGKMERMSIISDR